VTLAVPVWLGMMVNPDAAALTPPAVSGRAAVCAGTGAVPVALMPAPPAVVATVPVCVGMMVDPAAATLAPPAVDDRVPV